MSLGDDTGRNLGPLGSAAPARPTFFLARPTHLVADQMGRVFGNRHLLFKRNETEIFTINAQTGGLQRMTKNRFQTWPSLHAHVCASQTNQDEMSIPEKLAATILASDHLTMMLPELRAIHHVRLPILNEDGFAELLPQDFHPGSGVFTVHNDLTYATDRPLDDAVNYFRELFKDFGFVEGPNARSFMAQMCAIMTVYCTTMFEWGTLFPMFLYNANLPGSGKSLLVKIPLIAVHGRCDNTKLSNAENFATALDATAMSREPFLFLDDVKTVVSNNWLNAWLTQANWRVRQMRTHDNLSIPLRCVTFLTGNNMHLSQDIERRSVIIAMHSEETASRRLNTVRYSQHLDDAWVNAAENRADILSSCWALVRNWNENKDRSDGGRFMKPTYEKWSSIIPKMVAMAFGADHNPLDRPIMPNAGDRYEEDLRELVNEIINTYYERKIEEHKAPDRFYLNEIIGIARRAALFEQMIGDIGSIISIFKRSRLFRSIPDPESNEYDQDIISSDDLSYEQQCEQCWDYSDREISTKFGTFFCNHIDRHWTYVDDDGREAVWTYTRSRTSAGAAYLFSVVSEGTDTPF